MCVSCSYHILSQALCYVVAIGRQQSCIYQALAFVTAPDGAFVCACVYHVSSRPRKYKRTHIHVILWKMQIIGCCAGGTTTIRTHTSAGFHKQPRSHVTYTIQQQQRYISSTTAPALHTLTFVAGTALLCLVCVCAVFHQEILIFTLSVQFQHQPLVVESHSVPLQYSPSTRSK